MTDVLFAVLFAFAASGAFAVIYNIRGPGVLICAFGGGLAWFSYLLSAPLLQLALGGCLVSLVYLVFLFLSGGLAGLGPGRQSS